MPNHCQNYLVLGHKDSREIGRAKLAILEGTLFQEFYPCPQELLDTMSGFYSGEEQRELEEKYAANLAKYGFNSWYDWCVANWGTKWDAYDVEIISERYDNDVAELTLTFDTAWAPPTKFYDELLEQGFEVEAMYHEFGCQFCGHYTDGTDHYVEYTRETLEDIPEDIDEQFGITETIAEWDDEDDDDDDTVETVVAEGLNSVYNELSKFVNDPAFVERVGVSARAWAVEYIQNTETNLIEG
jgi:hypothetical protein